MNILSRILPTGERFMKQALAMMLLLLAVFQFPLSAKHSHDHSSEKSGRIKESPYISVKDNLQVYQIALFNLTSEVDNQTLQSIVCALVKNFDENYAKHWFKTVDIKTFGPEGLQNPDLFSGNYVPFIITDVTGVGLGAHFAHAPIGSPEETKGFLGFNGAGNNVSITTALGITTPPVYNNLPWGYASYPDLVQRIAQLKAANNPYVPDDPNQFLSFVMSHELAEILGDDTGQNWTFIDNYALAADSWKYAILDHNGNVTNAIGTNPDGTLVLPTLNSAFPDGWLMTIVQENGDALSWSIAVNFNAYKVKGWSISNFPLPSFWRGYYLAPDNKYDFLGRADLPLNPSGGLHEPFETYLTDLATGLQYVGALFNHGPVLASQEGYPPHDPNGFNVNVPPFTSYVVLFGTVAANNPAP